MTEIQNSSLEALTLALQIEKLKEALKDMDLPYIKEVSDKFYSQASFQDSAAVLNPRYNPTKSYLLREQAKGLSLLYDFICSLKRMDELKQEVRQTDSVRESIEKMFW